MIIRKIFNYLPELNRSQVDKSHNIVVEALIKLERVFPSDYKNLNLVNIILPKAYGNYTILDTAFYQYCRIKFFLNKTIIFKPLSRFLAYTLIKRKRERIYNSIKDNKYEIPIDYQRSNKFVSQDYVNKKYNIFAANTQTYLQVMILYINQSRFDNNLLVIPRCLENAEVLKDLNRSKLLFFEDFLTDNIILKFDKAKKDFSNTFEMNQKKLKEVFNLDEKNFYFLINSGLQNIFKYLLPQAFLFTLVYEEIFRQIKIKNVIGARVRKIFDRGLYQSAANFKINRYVLMHSNIGKDYKFIHSMGHFMDLTGVFAWGDLQKELIQADFLSDIKKIYVTGSPLFQKDIKKKNNSQLKRILYASSYNDFQEVADLVSITNSLPNDTELIIKVHPHINHEEYKKYVNSDKISLVPGDKSLEEIIPKSDLLITTISESAFQAMIRGVPALFYLISSRWINLGFDLYSFNQEEEDKYILYKKNLLRKKICKILYSEEFNLEFLENQDEFLNKRILMHPTPNGAASEIDKILN